MSNSANPSSKIPTFLKSISHYAKNLHNKDPDDDRPSISSCEEEEEEEVIDDNTKQEQKITKTKRRKSSLVPPTSKLQTFRMLVGIESPSNLHSKKRKRRNVGIYSRVIQGQRQYNKQHSRYSFLINGALGLQIVVAAALTALGAGNGPHKIVIVFGAVNTVIASFLAYLKGSGLPNRLKYYEDEYRKIREHIEQCEREFCRQGCGMDPRVEVARISEMYYEVKGDVEANTPDGFVSVAEIVKRKAGIPSNTATGTMAVASTPVASTSGGEMYNGPPLQFRDDGEQKPVSTKQDSNQSRDPKQRLSSDATLTKESRVKEKGPGDLV